MSKLSYIFRYLLIIQKLRKTGGATFKQINEYLEQESEKLDMHISISSRTFQRDLEEIRRLLGIDIQYSASRKEYYETEESFLNLSSQRVLEAVELMHALNIAENVSGFVFPESRRASGTELMLPLLQALRNQVVVEFIYANYWGSGITNRLAEPYALKEFKGRWYLVAADRQDNRIKTFGFDRIQNLLIGNSKFKRRFKAQEIQEMFQHCFGITNPTGAQPERIILSFKPEQGQYIKSFPLHHSQQVLSEDDAEVRISLFLYITHELVMELLSFGDTFSVLEPVSLRERLREIHKNAIASIQEN